VEVELRAIRGEPLETAGERGEYPSVVAPGRGVAGSTERVPVAM
jgi:hypothetical protein